LPRTIRVLATRLVAAPPSTVYRILADYRSRHPRILPPRYFSGYEVEHGGVGAGTRIRFRMTLAGSTRNFRAEVSEPEPGRVLVETDLESNGAVTTFTVGPARDSRDSMVTITTEWVSRGVRGVIERLFAPRLLTQVYAEELRNLDALARALTTG
jgi:hypothetical protein